MKKFLSVVACCMFALSLSAYDFCGHHFMASYIGCDHENLNDHDMLLFFLEEAAKFAGSTVLSTGCYEYSNGGFTAFLVLSESHASIHTYPEHDSCFVDFFTCGNDCSSELFDAILTEYLKPTIVKVSELDRD